MALHRENVTPVNILLHSVCVSAGTPGGASKAGRGSMWFWMGPRCPSMTLNPEKVLLLDLTLLLCFFNRLFWQCFHDHGLLGLVQ